MLQLCVGISVFGSCFVVKFLVFFYFNNHLAEEERAGCFCVVTGCALCLFLMVPWLGLQTVTVAFSGPRL